MEKLKLRIAFDVIDENGIVFSTKDYPNGFEIPLIVDNISKKECYLLIHFILERVLMLSGNKYLGHFFPKYHPLNQEAKNDKTDHKSEEPCLEYSLVHIEFPKPHNSDQQ